MSVAATVVRPLLARYIPDNLSRTARFATTVASCDVRRGLPVDVYLCPSASRSRLDLFVALLDLLFRMTPVVAEVRIHGPIEEIAKTLAGVRDYVPLDISSIVSPERAPIELGIGPQERTFVDAAGWCFATNCALPQDRTDSVIGAHLGAIEAAKWVFSQALSRLSLGSLAPIVWDRRFAFDAWRWGPCHDGHQGPTLPRSLPPLVLVGCGGVGAGLIWLLRRLHPGSIVLVDDDRVEWHNMNRLFYALSTDADALANKAAAAARFLTESGWAATAIPHKAEHEAALRRLQASADAGHVLFSAVGDPQSRLMLQRRGFPYLFDGATNSDGSAQVLCSAPGRSVCITCHIEASPKGVDSPPGQRCDAVTTQDFAGVVPHLSGYAGVLLGIEWLRSLLDSNGPRFGANTQGVLRFLDTNGASIARPCPHR
jgi:molybdopterin/thiamine biosynthesis adenylyltransferase